MKANTLYFITVKTTFYIIYAMMHMMQFVHHCNHFFKNMNILILRSVNEKINNKFFY